MTIYEIRSEIDRLIEEAVDMETGVVAEDYIDKLNELNMIEREKEINCALAYKNRMANVEAINSEIERLKHRAEVEAKKALSAYNYLEYCLHGETIEDDPRVQVKYTKSTVTMTDDDFVAWAKRHKRRDLLRIKPKPEPEPNKAEIAKALKAGQQLSHCWQEAKTKMKII